MEVLFCFLNWVSSFHTVDEESGNKMDTWNIATVMAPNILRESNEKEVKNVDQGAVRVVFDLIENNDEFSEVCSFQSCSKSSPDMTQVPPEIMELLSDDNASDMSAKEIMRQWEQRGKNPVSAAPASSPKNQGGMAKRKDERNAPQITQADNNPQAYAGEASVRQLPGGGVPALGPPSSQHSPVLGSPNPPYGQNPHDSTESHRTASPHRQSYRSPAFQKQTHLGTAGAG